MNLSSVNMLDVVARDTVVRHKASTNGGEYGGPCPFCGGTDRFLVWPNSKHRGGKGGFWCRQCEECGDAIDYIRLRDGVSFNAACRTLGCVIPARSAPSRPTASAKARPHRPSHLWRERAEELVWASVASLWGGPGEMELNWLRARGLDDNAIFSARLGVQFTTVRAPGDAWGLVGDDLPTVHIPSGIVIPWRDREGVHGLQVRLLDHEVKYRTITGSDSGLYGGHLINAATPVMLVEGVFDALIIRQHAGDNCLGIATGSTTGARDVRWLMRLATAPVVLVAFDADEAGDKGATYWTDALPNAIRWRPYWGDVNDMALHDADIRGWIAQGIDRASRLCPESRVLPAG